MLFSWIFVLIKGISYPNEQVFFFCINNTFIKNSET